MKKDCFYCPKCGSLGFRREEVWGDRLKCGHCGEWSDTSAWFIIPAPTEKK